MIQELVSSCLKQSLRNRNSLPNDHKEEATNEKAPGTPTAAGHYYENTTDNQPTIEAKMMVETMM
jgi:hypothetical protein